MLKPCYASSHLGKTRKWISPATEHALEQPHDWGPIFLTGMSIENSGLEIQHSMCIRAIQRRGGIAIPLILAHFKSNIGSQRGGYFSLGISVSQWNSAVSMSLCPAGGRPPPSWCENCCTVHGGTTTASMRTPSESAIFPHASQFPSPSCLPRANIARDWSSDRSQRKVWTGAGRGQGLLHTRSLLPKRCRRDSYLKAK
jgi:hypothetical protein